ncbi:MAG: MMPL family transporter [Acidobacteria bacterium]|nr:MMPL family transporter [Acidobacteriota bacterium]
MSGFSIRNPYFVLVCALILCIVGAAALLRMPVDMFPALDQTVVVVATFYPGMPPEQIENDLTGRLERFLTLAPGIDYMESRSLPGVSIIRVAFQRGTNPDTATSAIVNLAAAEQRRLPPGTIPSLVVRADASSLPVCLVAVKGANMTEAELRDITHYKVRTQLAKLPGAAVPPPFGGKYRQIMVYVDPQRMQGVDVSPMDVVRALNAANVILPSGNIRIGPLDYPIYTNSQFRDLEGILDVPVRVDGRTTLTIGDVGTAKDAAQIQYNLVRVDGQRSAYQPVLRQGGDTNTIAVVDGIKKELQDLLDVPDELVSQVVFDQSLFVKKAIHTLTSEAGIGIFMTSLMILLFLGSFRATLAVSLSIPLSALVALLAIAAGGGSINSMTLGGLALAFSRLIDDSVVVAENVFRYMENGAPPRVAAEQGAREVALPVLASTVTTAIVFFPVVFLYGVSRDLFSALALTVVLALFASYFVSLTIVPLFLAVFARPPIEHGHARGAGRITEVFNTGFEAVTGVYDRLLGGAIRRPAAVVVFLLALAGASTLLYPLLGVSYFPRTDAGQFVIRLKAPPGTSLDLTEEKVKQVERIVREEVAEEDLQMMVANVGIVPDYSAIYNSNSAPHTGFLQVGLTEDHKTGSYEYMDRVRERLRVEHPELSVFLYSGGFVDSVLNAGMPAPIDIQVSGPNLEDPYETVTKIAREVRKVADVEDVFIPQDLDTPVMRIRVDRHKAALLGLTEREVVSNLITAVSSNQMIEPTFWTDPRSNNDYYLTVQYPEGVVKSLDDIRNIPLRAANSDKATTLGAISDLHLESGPTEITHYALRKVVDAYVTLSSEDMQRPARRIQQIVDSMELPKGVRVEIRGLIEPMNQSIRSFGVGLLMAVALLYLVLVAQFKSFLDPVLILLAVPMGLIGVLLILWGTDTTLNVQSLMGVVMMVGIVVSNSILLVDFVTRLRRDGKSLEEAVAEAARVRLRPIVMTSLATIIGLMPMAMKLGTGSEAYAPLARAVIGGMAVSLLLTVFIVPAAYLLAYRRRRHIIPGQPIAA